MKDFILYGRSRMRKISTRSGVILMGCGLLALAILPACRPHRASETVPGWNQKQAEKQKEQITKEQAEKVDKNAPSFFPSPQNANP